MMDNYFLGIDTGTQGVRAGVCNENGTMLSSHAMKWTTEFPEVGWAEQKPAVWWKAIKETVQMCTSELGSDISMKIRACCICSTSSTVLAVDNNGNPLTDAIMWMDARAVKEAEEINRTSNQVLEYCGGSESFEWLIPKILWLKRNRKDIYEKCSKIVEQLDWIQFMLTGEWNASICNATCKWNYVKSLGGFHKEFFDEIGLSDYSDKMITNVLNIGDTAGTIKRNIAEELNINPAMKVVEGGIDAHMALLGMNAFQPGQMGIIMGTSFVHLSNVCKKPMEFKGIWGPYEGAIIPGYWLLEGGQISAAGLINWFRDNFHIGADSEETYQILAKAASEISPGAEGITVLDYFQGNRTPYKDPFAKGVIYGLNIEHGWKQIYRALLESVAFGTRSIVDNQINQGCGIDTITACGGVTKNSGWMQIISDVTNKEIVVNEDSQAGVLGDCIAAAYGSGLRKTFAEAADCMVKKQKIYYPDSQKHLLYEEPFRRYRELYISLKKMMSDQERGNTQ